MAATRELNIKPSFMTDLLIVPHGQVAQVMEKVRFMLADPSPDGAQKKKLKGKKDLYRLRIGDFRAFYSYGDNWIRLLALRRRNKQTYSDEAIVAETPGAPIVDDDDDDDLAWLPPAHPTESLKPEAPKPSQLAAPASTSLPMAINLKLLKQLKIPVAHYAALLECISEEALLAAPVPSDVLGRILDALFPRPLEQLVDQPDLLVQEPEDLVRYAEGELFGFLLRLDDDQKKLVDWALKGPTMIKGGAGTGKSTVALHRVRATLNRKGASQSERVLFTTYTRALLAASRQLLGELLEPDQMERVTVSTCDEVSRAIVGSKRKLRRIETDLHAPLRRVRKNFSPTGKTILEKKARGQLLARLSDRYLLEEFEWIIEGRGLSTPQEYLDAPRPGRGIAFKPAARAAVWELYEAFRADLDAMNVERFAPLRHEALQIVRNGQWKEHWDYVLVDEAQDLSPVALALLAAVAKTPEGLFFAADDKQSLYSRNYSWAQADPRLTFTGRTAVLKRNYRSTAEIDLAAFDVLAPEEGQALVPSASVHSGPLPVLARDWRFQETPSAVTSFCRQMAKHFHMKLSASAVLVPTAEIGERLAQELTATGLPARYFAGRDLDLSAEVTKVITLHSAKGLEFPIVAICGFDEGTYPTEDEFDDRGEYEEKLRNERRRLYVGMTRAMRGLLVVVNEGCIFDPLIELKDAHWHVWSHS